MPQYQPTALNIFLCFLLFLVAFRATKKDLRHADSESLRHSKLSRINSHVVHNKIRWFCIGAQRIPCPAFFALPFELPAAIPSSSQSCNSLYQKLCKTLFHLTCHIRPVTYSQGLICLIQTTVDKVLCRLFRN